MTDGYDRYQNALAERVNRILKNEFLLNKFKDLAEARKMVKKSIKIYKGDLKPEIQNARCGASSVSKLTDNR